MSGSLRPLAGSVREVLDLVDAWWVAAEPAPLIVETSGSTGRPKRVVLSRRALRASGAATAEVLGVEGQWMLALPITYVAGLQVALRSLAAGHPPVVLADHPSFAAAAAALRPGVDHLVSLVPTQLHRLLADDADRSALARFHTVLLGGGPIDPALRLRAEAEGVRVVATYGSAETAGGCVYDGRPLPGVRLAIEPPSAEGAVVEPDGSPAGRVRVAGPQLFDGYDGDPGLSAEVLVDGWFRTSDAGRLVDGRLELLGRIDDVVLTGGLNVPAPAVARRLREHPDVAEAEVIGVPDLEWGRRLVAFVVAGSPLETAEVRDWIGRAHPRSWAPRQVVLLDAIPLLDNGKPDRMRLTSLAATEARG